MREGEREGERDKRERETKERGEGVEGKRGGIKSKE